MGPHGQRASRIPPSSSAGSIPETAATKLHPGVMAKSMDSVRMLHDGAAPTDSQGMQNHVGGMHTSAGDVRVPPSPTKAAPLMSYPVNGKVSSSPTPYTTTSVAMRRTVSASNATQQSRRPMSTSAASHIQNGKPREFLPGSIAQYDLLTPRNRPLPPTPIDHMQISPKRQQQPPKYQPPPHIPQVGLQSHTQNPRQQSQGRIPVSKMQMPVTRFQSRTPGSYYQYQTRPQVAQGQVPHRQPISQRLSQGYAPPHARPPVSYPQAGASHVAHTQVSPSHVKTQVSSSHVKTQMSPSHVKTQVSPTQTQVPVTQPFQPVPAQVPVPTHSSSARQQNPSSTKTSPSEKSATATQSSGKPANYRPPTENYHILLPKEVQSIKDTPGSRDSTSSSLSAELQQYTDQMSRALEQFDSLLAPPPKRHIVQTSL